MSFDVVVVGGGTAGCVLAARLSENPDRRVCLLEAGPDYGPLAGGGWPDEILDPRALPLTNTWESGEQNIRTLGGRLIGGSSAVNACMVVEGTPADYEEWGPDWSYEHMRPFLDRARSELRAAPANTERPAPFHVSFLEAAQSLGFELLTDANDPDWPVGVATSPANVLDGRRWNAAIAYVDPARGRPNLTIAADTTVDHVVLDMDRATGVAAADGRQFDAETVVLAAGAYFSPAILLRSGIGPPGALEPLGIPVVSDVPTGARLLDHCGTNVAWEPSVRFLEESEAHEHDEGLFQAHAVLKAASTGCPAGSWDLHVLSWITPTGGGQYEPAAIVFHMKPASTGRVRLRSRDPRDAPVVEHGFLSREEDLIPILEGIVLARRLAATSELAGHVGPELRPGGTDPEQYVRETIRSYYHPAGTCALGEVVDVNGRVLGTEGLVVADASIMPTIPRANTNLTTAAIAERIATSFD